MSEVNIDAALVREGGAELSRTDEKLVEMSNGCICCTLREDLLVEVRRLANEGRFDQLVIESTGISEPLPVAETFTFEDEDGNSLNEFARLDTMVTVVDAFNFLKDYSSVDSLQQRGESLGEQDERTVVDLLIDQIEFCDVIVLNKIDLIDQAQQDQLIAILKTLNPRARIEIAQFGKVALDKILNTQLFDFDEAAQAPGWLKSYAASIHLKLKSMALVALFTVPADLSIQNVFMIWYRLNGRELCVPKAFLVGCRTDIGLLMVTSGSNGSTRFSWLLVGSRFRRRLVE